MFTKEDADKMRNVRNYLGDAAWIESMAVLMEGTLLPAKPVPQEWQDAMSDAELADMDLPKKPVAKKATKKGK